MKKTAATQQTLLQLCLPLLLNSALGLATTLLDALIISRYSKAAAAAVSIANQILAVAYDLSLLLGVGAVVLISHSLGRSDERRARDIAAIAITANTVFGVLIGLLLLVMGPMLVEMVRTPPELVADTSRYIAVIALAIPFNSFLMAAVACLRGFARVRTILLLGVFAFPAYLFLNYALVLGLGPVPSLGVLGSALATLIVRVGSVAVLLVLMARVLKLSWRWPRPFREAARLVRELGRLSYPSVLDNVSYGFYQLVLVSFIAGLGVTAVVSRFYTLALTAFLAVAVMAISQANEVLVGYRIGAGRGAQVHARALRSGIVSAALATVLAIVTLWFDRPLVGLFTDDEEVYRQVHRLLYLTIFIQPLTGLNTVLFHSLRVIGDVMAPVLFSQVAMWCVAVPLAWLLCKQLGFGVEGLWLVFVVEESMKTLYMVFRWSRMTHGPGRALLQPVGSVPAAVSP